MLKLTGTISLPPGTKENSKTQVGKVNKAIYGLATFPKYWYFAINELSTFILFERSCREPCLYSYTNIANTVTIYVDHILIVSELQRLIDDTLCS